METKSSAYRLLFREAPPETYAVMPPEQREQLLQRWNNWADGLVAQGKMRHGHPLEPQGLTISGARGQHIVDGPFAETKEAIGGYFYLEGVDLAEATAIARQCPQLQHGMVIELRPVAGACHLAHSLGRQTMKVEAV